MVLHELDRRRAEVGYVKTADGFEVDFLVQVPGEKAGLVQVCADPSAPGTLARELRALEAAAVEHPNATRRLLVLDRDQLPRLEVRDVTVQPVYEWLLDGGQARDPQWEIGT